MIKSWPAQILTFLFIALLCMGYSPALVARYNVSGIITNKHQEPVAFAVVTLISEEDSIIVETAIPDSAGKFVLTAPDLLHKRLVVAAMGYKSIIRLIDDTVSLHQHFDFVLEESNQDLDEITVSAARPIFERKIDRIIYNVSANISSAGGNALEAIKKAPGVVIQQNENVINLLGKNGVLILVNDRLLQLSGEDLFAYLQGMSSDNIDRIEVITSPPAKYDAAGNSGLINIVLKKNSKVGFNGNMRAGYEQASYGKGILGGDINYRSGGLNLYGNANYSNGSNQIVESLETPYPGQLFSVTDNYKRTMKPVQYTAGIDYEIHKKGVIGIQWISSNANRVDDANDVIEVMDVSRLQLDSTMVTKGYATRKNSNNVFNVNYVCTMDTLNKKLTLNVNRLWFSGERRNEFTTVNYLRGSAITTGIQSHNGANGAQDIQITTAQADIELPYTFASLSLGGKLSFIDNNSNNVFGYFDQNGYHEDPFISNGFAYNEKVQALYISAQRSVGKWSFQAGLRGEFTQTKGYARSLSQTHTNQYFNLFPTAYIQYQQSEDHNWNINYSKRINRPDYRSLDPYRAYATPYHYGEGNPFLLPSFNHNIELAYTFKTSYTFSAYYQYERNHFGSVWMADPVRNITSGISRNFANVISYGMNAMGTFQPFPWWEIQVQLGMQDQQLKSKVYTATEQSYKNRSGYAGVNNSLVFNKAKTITAEANFFYLTRYREDFLEINGIGSIDIGLRALLLDKRMSVNINAGDILATQRAKGVHVVTGQIINNYFDTRNIRLSLSYKLGNNKVKARRERSTGIEEEKGRVN